MVRHIVMWKVKEQEDFAEVSDRFRRMMEELKAVCPEIIEYHVGINTKEAEEFDICYDSVFASAEDVQTYFYHPVHTASKEYMASVTCRKAVFDYSY